MEKGDIMNDNFIAFADEIETEQIDRIASSGNQTSGPNGITKEIREEAIKLAESSKGLDIAAFQKKHNISVMNVDELIKG